MSGRYIDDDGNTDRRVHRRAAAGCIGGRGAGDDPSDGSGGRRVAAGRLEGALRDNFHEVVSVVSAMLNVISDPHLRLADVVDGVPSDVVELMAGASAHRQYDVTIVGQAGGTLALVGA